jgi:hypothetical protein
MNAYIVSTYDEHGAEDVAVTLDKCKVVEMLSSYKRTLGYEVDNNELIKLHELLDDEEVIGKLEVKRTSGRNISGGWGGFMLHIVEVDAWEKRV